MEICSGLGNTRVEEQSTTASNHQLYNGSAYFSLLQLRRNVLWGINRSHACTVSCGVAVQRAACRHTSSHSLFWMLISFYLLAWLRMGASCDGSSPRAHQPLYQQILLQKSVTPHHAGKATQSTRIWSLGNFDVQLLLASQFRSVGSLYQPRQVPADVQKLRLGRSFLKSGCHG